MMSLWKDNLTVITANLTVNTIHKLVYEINYF